MLTVLSTLGPHRLDAGRYIVASRFRCRSFDRRYVVGALSTGRCLPAAAPRVLVMGDEVWTRSFSPDNHFTPLFKSQPLGQPEKAVGHEPQIEPWLTHRTTTALASFRNRSASSLLKKMHLLRWNNRSTQVRGAQHQTCVFYGEGAGSQGNVFLLRSREKYFP